MKNDFSFFHTPFFALKCKKMLNREKFLFSKRIRFRNIASGRKPDLAF